MTLTNTSDFIRRRPGLDVFALLAVSAVLTLPIFVYGIPQGNDLPQHFQFAVAFSDSLQNGVYFPGWNDASNFGFGDPGVRFYPPLTYYLLAAAHLITGNWHLGSVFVIGLLFFMGGLGAYLWCGELFMDRNGSLLAGFVFTITPYHVNQIYNAFTIAEFAGAAVLPFCFWAVTRVCRSPRPMDCVWLATSYACLLLTHLPLSVIGSLSLLIYALTFLSRSDWLSRVIALAGGVLGGVALSAFYWLRIGPELSYIRHSQNEFVSGSFGFTENFLLSFTYLWTQDDAGRSMWFADLMFAVTLALFLPGLLLLLYQNARKAFEAKKPVFVLLAFSIFLATPLSRPLWQYFRPVQLTQFPWRSMTIISLAAAVIAGACLRPVVEMLRTEFRPFVILVIGLFIAAVVFTGAQVIRPASFSPAAAFNDSIETLRPSKSFECWWTRRADKSAFADRRQASAGERQVEILKWSPVDRSIRIGSGLDRNLRIATFYYPHWHASVNGTAVKVENDRNGVILVPLPAGDAVVDLRFDEPSYSRIGGLISGIALLVVLVTAAADTVRSKFNTNPHLK